MSDTHDEAVGLYRTMCRIRAFEDAVENAVLAGEIPGGSHIYSGQEAVAAGAIAALDERDKVISHYRGHGHSIACGADLKALMAEVYGKETGCGHGRVGSLHLSSPDDGLLVSLAIVGAGSPIADGVAFTQKRAGEGGVTVVFFGDGASDRGTEHEAMNLAALWDLPVIFAVENNGYAYFTPQAKHQKIRDISVRASAYGMPGLTVDGNDAEAVLAATRSAVGRGRAGEGPTLLEFKTYRYSGHFVGDPAPYRDPAEAEEWQRDRDPIKRLATRLVDRGVADKQLEDIAEAARAEVEEAVRFARESPDPNPDRLADITYAERGGIRG
jgi:TPP-dependent pyruvate/acetoin dehydrogenase alpha subunit